MVHDLPLPWLSEYQQLLLLILLTAQRVQKGSPESKPLDRADRRSDQDQKVRAYAV